jgi:UDPglucose 6-dehydrogenase
MRIAVIGLGKLGSPLAAVLASKGHDVVCADVDAEFVRLLNEGQAPVSEPGLQQLIDYSRGRLRATTSTEEAVAQSEITFVIVPTPSDADGAFSNRYVLAAVARIGAALRKKDAYHVVNITSTVMPGSMTGVIGPALEEAAGRPIGSSLGLCYNPEFIALGTVIHDMLAPDMVLIGQSDSRAGDRLESLYRTVCENDPRVKRLSFIDAEVAKIALNTYVTTKISYANMLADLCERLPGANVDAVTSAVGLDTRIGTKYLRGAVGYGGPCFPRDNIALAAMAQRLGARADLAEATHRTNDYQTERLMRLARYDMAAGATIGVLGLSYKPGTAVVECSPGIALAEGLSAAGYRVVVHDPMALEVAMKVLGNRVSPAESAASCIADADCVVIMTASPEYRTLDPSLFARPGGRLRVVDCWRLLPVETFAPLVDLVHSGRGSRPKAE